MIVGMQPNARHPILLAAAPQVFLPIGQLRVHRTERDEKSRAVLFAVRGEPRVDSADIPMQQAVETPYPHLSDSVLPHPRHKVRGLVTRQPPERPSRTVCIRVDNHGNPKHKILEPAATAMYCFPPAV